MLCISLLKSRFKKTSRHWVVSDQLRLETIQNPFKHLRWNFLQKPVNSRWSFLLSTVNYFRKILHLRCLAEPWYVANDNYLICLNAPGVLSNNEWKILQSDYLFQITDPWSIDLNDLGNSTKKGTLLMQEIHVILLSTVTRRSSAHKKYPVTKQTSKQTNKRYSETKGCFLPCNSAIMVF